MRESQLRTAIRYILGAVYEGADLDRPTKNALITAVDQGIDMGRSRLNAAGAIVDSLVVDKRLGLLDRGGRDYPELIGQAGGAACPA